MPGLVPPIERRLLAESALRRIATLVAGNAGQPVVLEAVAVEASALLAPSEVRVTRGVAAGEGDITVPILVGGERWGALVTTAPVPPGAEAWLADLAELTATAIANVRAREALRGLADSQSALRQVATLVAQGAEPRNVFATVAVEASRVLGVGAVALLRYDADNQTFTKIFGTHGAKSAIADGDRYPVADCPEGARLIHTGRPARVDDWSDLPGPVAARHRDTGYGQAVAAPIIIDNAIWGYVGAYAEGDEVLPPGSETRLADLTHLMAAAIANVQTRDALRDLAAQQGAALRRVATLVAQQATPGMIFNAVAGEASRALRVDRVDVGRCLADGSVGLLGSTRTPRLAYQRFSADGAAAAAEVLRTGRPARIDGPAPAEAGRFRSVVGAPILVDTLIWGVVVVLSGEILPPGTETRLTDFTHLVASSISNVNARDKLIASRARIVAASDQTRRKIERDLHDGVQQRIVSLGLRLRAVEAGDALPPGARSGIGEVVHGLDGVLEEIRVFSQGLHPALLSRSGLGPALRALARRSAVPVRLDAGAIGRFPEPVEIAVYYVVSEALANAAKHSRATEVEVTVTSDTAGVAVSIADDGVGGAVLERGSGLIGLVDRVEALGGRLALTSPTGHGTRIRIDLPATTGS